MSETIFITGSILAVGPIPSVLYIILCVLSLVLLVMGSKYTHKGFCSKEKCSKENWVALGFLFICWVFFLLCMGYSIDKLITFAKLGEESSVEESSGIVDPLYIVALISCILFFILWCIGTKMFHDYNTSMLRAFFYGIFSFFFVVASLISLFVSIFVLYMFGIINNQS